MRLPFKTLAALVFIGCACASLSYGQQEPLEKPISRVVEFYRPVDMALILAQFANDDGVVIGLETDPEKPNSKIELHLRNVTFSQILDAIIKEEPRYLWRQNGKFIEFVPARGGVSVLDTPITNFQINDVNPLTALNHLFGLPEVHAGILSMNLNRRPLSLQTDRTKGEKLSFNLSGVTLRQALNRIAEESRAKFWVFRRFPDGSFEICLSPC